MQIQIQTRPFLFGTKNPHSSKENNNIKYDNPVPVPQTKLRATSSAPSQKQEKGERKDLKPAYIHKHNFRRDCRHLTNSW